jgi:hypothetical protein
MSIIQRTFSYTKALFASVLILFGVSSVGAQELEEIIVTAQSVRKTYRMCLSRFLRIPVIT